MGAIGEVAEEIQRLKLDWLAIVVVVFRPAAIGIIVGLGVQKEWLYNLLRKFRLDPVHGIPSAWDWKFMSLEAQWIMVYLKDKEDPIYALYDENCFVSTDVKERDLYLSNIYRWVDQKMALQH